MGKDSDPMSLHKYLYANSDPVNHIDPSGQMSLGSMMTGMNLQISLNITTTLVARTMVTRSMLAAGLRYGLQAEENKSFGRTYISQVTRGMQKGDYYIVVPMDFTYETMVINKK